MPRCSRWARSAAALLAVASLVACDGLVPAAEIGDRTRALGHPHIVLIVVDTLRADWTGPYGDTRGATPELDRWAGRGVVFERALAQSSWTKVSMASLLSSLWPRSHGVRETTDGLGEAAQTLAEALRAAGYATYGVQSNGWLEQTFGFHQGFDRYMFPHGGGGRDHHSSVWPHADNVYREAARLIEAHPDATPMFLYLHFMDVHEYASPPEHRRFGSGDTGHYVAAIAWVDEILARVREKLDRQGLLDDSILVLTSDHGESFGENGVHGHARNVRTQVLHVPLVFRLPFRVAPVRVATQVRGIDVAPTLLDLAGVTPPDSWDGRSLVPAMEGAPQEDLTSHASLSALLYRDARLQDSITDGRFSYARDRGEHTGEYLFDRQVDPGENVNLATIETERTGDFRKRMDAHLAGAARAGAVQSEVRIDPALAQKLRALGYLAD